MVEVHEEPTTHTVMVANLKRWVKSHGSIHASAILRQSECGVTDFDVDGVFLLLQAETRLVVFQHRADLVRLGRAVPYRYGEVHADPFVRIAAVKQLVERTTEAATAGRGAGDVAGDGRVYKFTTDANGQ